LSRLPTIASLVKNRGWNPENKDPTMVFLDYGGSDDNQLPFAGESYDEVEEEEDDEEPEKENEQLLQSHLELCIAVNGEEISVSEESVGKIHQDDKHEVTLVACANQAKPSPPPCIQISQQSPPAK
jgi:hypothetical protein